MQWYNYFVSNKYSRLINGHLPADKLLETILNHDGEEAYACYFDLDKDQLKVEWDNEEYDKDGKKIYQYLPQGVTPENPAAVNNGLSFTEYEGICRPALNCVAFDFDSKDPQESLEDVRNFIKWLDIEDAVVFFSGSKGFHVLVHFDYFGLEPSENLVIKLREMAVELKNHFPTLDSGIYNYNRKFRVPFTKHDKTGLFKSVVAKGNLNVESLEYIKEEAKKINYPFDFIPKPKERKPLPQILEVLESTKRESYEVEKHRAGTREEPSPFEAYDGKLCIKKMLENTCDTVGRNNACMRIVNDFYRTGMPYNLAEQRITKWADNCGLPKKEMRQILHGIYDRGENYNFGCQDEIKSSFCSAKCAIYKKLSPDKRPTPLDAPKTQYLEEQKTKKPTQKEIATELLEGEFRCRYSQDRREYWGGHIIRQNDELFIFDDGYWTELGPTHIAKIKRLINIYLDGKGTTSQIENVYKMFLLYVPAVPDNVDMYLPPSNKVNFANGVLEVKRNKDGKYYKVFREGHSPSDYLTSKHSLNFSEASSPLGRSSKFMGVLETLTEGYTDKEKMIKSMAQMFGAALVPLFPMMYYFYGPAKTGKSTLILIMEKLLDKANICNVQPSEFHGFRLEDMIGKKVNLFTDVNTRKLIDEDIVKVIFDRTPVNINRKNRVAVRATLPAIHIFAGNDLMRSLEVSRAFERRFTIFPMKNIIQDTESYFANASDFAQFIYDEDPQEVLNFALWGLDLLIERNGRFIEFDSARESMDEWRKRGDIVEQFLEDLTTEGVEFFGENVLLERCENEKINRSFVWKIFDAWQESSIKNPYEKIGKKTFYVRMDEKGFRYIESHGHWLSGLKRCEDKKDSESHDLGRI